MHKASSLNSAIAENASSPPNVRIVTLENHCKAEGQKIIAYTLRGVLGDKLYPEGRGSDYTRIPER